jgi:conjugal transfer pilus assembly protein TraD
MIVHMINLMGAASAAPMMRPPRDLVIITAYALAGLVGGAIASAAAWRLTALAPSVAAAMVLPGAVVAVANLPVSLRLATVYTAAIVAANAVLWIRRVQDHQAGGEIAASAKDRRGLGTLTLWLYSLGRVRAGRLTNSRGGLIGRTRHDRLLRIAFGGEKASHLLAIGETGLGKTQTLVLLTRNALAGSGGRGGLIYIDPKGDPAVLEALQCYADAVGRRFIELSLTAATTYNALARGGATEVSDKVLAGEAWSEMYYLRLAQWFVQLVVQALQDASVTVTLRSLVDHLDAGRLLALARTLPDDKADQLLAELDTMSERQWEALDGTRKRLAVIANGAFGRLLEPSASSDMLDLFDALRNGDVVVVRLAADQFPLAAEMVATSILIDLMGIAAQAQDGSLPPSVVMVDEASAVPTHIIVRLFERARGAGMSIVLATQHLADLNAADVKAGVAPGTVLRQIVSNVATIIVHRVGEPDAAEYLAGIAGTESSREITRQLGPSLRETTGMGSVRQGRSYIVHPDVIKRLGVGEAVVIRKAKRGRARALVVKILNPAKLRLPKGGENADV